MPSDCPPNSHETMPNERIHNEVEANSLFKILQLALEQTSLDGMITELEEASNYSRCAQVLGTRH
jgi:hypothetical protein